MERFLVTIEREGREVPVGSISGENSADACFCYASDYLTGPDAAPVSVSLPLQKEAFSAARTKTFFEGLLPEGFTRRAVAEWMRTDEDDDLALLYGLGRECLGALRIRREGPEPEPAYEPLSLEEVRALAAEGATRSAELVTKAHLSLTGASGKVGLYRDEASGTWYLPVGTAPSTHIVKQSHIRLRQIVTNEQLVQMTAGRLGIDVPESRIINTGSGEDGEVLFATGRYDRVIPENADRIGGLPRPQRLHQEDVAQALAIPASAKYERAAEQGYLRRLFDLLRSVSANPVEDQLKLWDRIVFCVLAGNTDAHIKNISLLYSPNLKGVRLAPAYDLVSTAVYESSTRDMAFRIGGVLRLDDIDAEALRRAARDAGLGGRMAMQRAERMREAFPAALLESAEALEKQGFSQAGTIARKILERGGISHVM
ncbi:MAG: HipA domain-containing protein [Lachnospiraceae bacterium]|nr:HipA domain-containing protein [Lachnospiraceae bacterium]